MKNILLFLAAMILFSACASGPTMTWSDFVGGAITSGKGGTKRNIDGMDVWENGAPSHKFKVLGIITDEYPNYTDEARSSERNAVALARQHGADALVLVAAQSQFVSATTDTIGGSPGYYGYRPSRYGPVFIGGGPSYSITTANYDRAVKYEAIQFHK